MTPSKTEDTFPGGESIDGNLCFCLRVVFSRLFIIHPNVIHAQGIFSKNKQHKSNMLANQLDLSSSCLNYYPPRFVNVTLPIQTRLLRNAMSHTTPIDPDLNQDFSINELLSAINDVRTLHPDQATSATKCLNICPKNLWKSCDSRLTKSVSSAKFRHPGYIPLLSLFQNQTNLRTYRLPTAQYP